MKEEYRLPYGAEEIAERLGKVDDIPTKVSQLENDAEYLTKQEVEDIFPMKMVTYADLVAMRDDGRLVPGQQYRIIDFVTTVDQADAKSAGHQFDVIVTADGPSVLNEKARAAISEGDTYFTEAGANLKAWQLWYCLDNDKSRFEWADDKIRAYVNYSDNSFGELIVVPYPEDETMEGMKVLYLHNKEDGSQLYIVEGGSVFDEAVRVVGTCLKISSGKGVIYRMIDEWQNDLPYDFKNVVYEDNIGFLYNQWGKDYAFIRNESLDKTIDDIPYYGYSADIEVMGVDTNDFYLIDEIPSTASTLYKSDGSVISMGGSILSVTTSYSAYYTFYEVRTPLSDKTLIGLVYDIKIARYVFEDKEQRLNRNVFMCGKQATTPCYDIVLGDNCHNNKFNITYAIHAGTNCYRNEFEGYYIDVGNGCHENIIVGSYIKLGYKCLRNNIRGYCVRCGSNCFDNILGTNKSADNITMGVSCKRIDLKNGCNNIVFGDSCAGISAVYGVTDAVFHSGVGPLRLVNQASEPVSGFVVMSKVNGDINLSPQLGTQVIFLNSTGLPAVKGLE